MDKREQQFGQTAVSLSQNPLGIIALFIVLVYGFAALVVGVGMNIDSGAKTPIIWFLVLFPILVLAVFGWLVSKHHMKLYSPKDFPTSDHFMQVLALAAPKLKKVEQQQLADSDTGAEGDLPEERTSEAENQGLEMKAADAHHAEVGPGGDTETHRGSSHQPTDLRAPSERSDHRRKLYADSRKVFIVHTLTPSATAGQKYDIYIYVKRHNDAPTDDVVAADFFFGKSWGNRIFVGTRDGNRIGVSTSAYGPFLCTCIVAFSDGFRVSISRYIDFDMGEAMERAIA